jgi:nitrous oxide reductase accessory protein NosL
MLISSERGTGEIVSATNDTRFYDDVACLAADWAQHGSGSSAFVRLATGAWSNAHTAWYARPAGARTAMGSGVVAFAIEAEARAADAASRALRFDEVLHQAGEAR